MEISIRVQKLLSPFIYKLLIVSSMGLYFLWEGERIKEHDWKESMTA